MTIISCYGCGVVLDTDNFFIETRIKQSKNFDGYTEINYVRCPVCKGDVTVNTKDVHND